jgi:hypothetical protein
MSQLVRSLAVLAAVGPTTACGNRPIARSRAVQPVALSWGQPSAILSEVLSWAASAAPPSAQLRRRAEIIMAAATNA